MPRRPRLDQVLVEREMVPTRAKAQALIMARRVRINGEYADKAGTPVAEEDVLEIVALEHPWVGRGGIKLDGAIEHFGVDVDGKVCADIGASTGGFTDVLLSRGARRVYAIDVGYGQLDQKLRDDPRVVVMEKTNARYLTSDDVEAVDLVSIDVSFISLEMILPAAISIGAPGVEIVALIKPQFEAGREKIGKGGIVRDPEIRREVVERITTFVSTLGLEVAGVIESPVRGAEGNVEFLMYAHQEVGPVSR